MEYLHTPPISPITCLKPLRKTCRLFLAALMQESISLRYIPTCGCLTEKPASPTPLAYLFLTLPYRKNESIAYTRSASFDSACQGITKLLKHSVGEIRQARAVVL